MNNSKNVWVGPNGGGGWKVQRQGAERASSLHPTQAAAIEAGRTLAQNAKSELFVQGRDGAIRARDSYGNDPFPPRDKNR